MGADDDWPKSKAMPYGSEIRNRSCSAKSLPPSFCSYAPMIPFTLTMYPERPKQHCREIIAEICRRRKIWKGVLGAARRAKRAGVVFGPWHGSTGVGLMLGGKTPTDEQLADIKRWFHYMFEKGDLDTGELRWWVWRLAEKYPSCAKFKRHGKPRIV